MKNKKLLMLGLFLVSIYLSATYAFPSSGRSDVYIIDERATIRNLESFSGMRTDIMVSSMGRGNLSSFNISVLLTNNETIFLGDFAFVLREIEEIRPHGRSDQYENYIDYLIPEYWNSSQVLTDTVTVKELKRNPVRSKIANEPLFIRGVDYPEYIPFDEIEIQVDLVRYYTDVDETEYIAWVRVSEVEEDFDIKSIIIEGYGGIEK